MPSRTDMSHVLILITQEAIILLTHIVVRNAQDELTAQDTLDGQPVSYTHLTLPTILLV